MWPCPESICCGGSMCRSAISWQREHGRAGGDIVRKGPATRSSGRYWLWSATLQRGSRRTRHAAPWSMMISTPAPGLSPTLWIMSAKPTTLNVTERHLILWDLRSPHRHGAASYLAGWHRRNSSAEQRVLMVNTCRGTAGVLTLRPSVTTICEARWPVPRSRSCFDHRSNLWYVSREEEFEFPGLCFPNGWQSWRRDGPRATERRQRRDEHATHSDTCSPVSRWQIGERFVFRAACVALSLPSCWTFQRLVLHLLVTSLCSMWYSVDGDSDAKTFTIGVLKVTAILSLGHGAREGEHAPPLVNATTRQDFPHRVRREMGADPCPQAEAGPTPPAKWYGGPRRHQVPIISSQQK